MNDPKTEHLVQDLKKCMADKAAIEPPRTPLNIGFGLGSPVSSHTSSDSSPFARFMTPSGGVSTLVASDSGYEPSKSADSLDSIGRPPSVPISPPPPPVSLFTNPLYSSGTNHLYTNKIVEDDQPPSPIADFQTAEVHHREPLTRPISPSHRAWSANPPIEVDPISVTVIDPDKHSSVYRPIRDASDSAPLSRFIEALRRIWPVLALAQAPGWFEQWWNKGAHQPARPKKQSIWTLLCAGKFKNLDLNRQQALLQTAAFLLLVFLVLFLVYLLYDGWVQSRQGVATAASGEGNPSGRITYITRGQFRRERARRKGRKPFATQTTVSTPSAGAPPTPDYAALYECPPRWVP